MSVLDNFDNWKEFLKGKLQNAEESGASEGAIGNFATEVGEYLATNVDPKNDEQRILSDLWNAANENEKEAIAGAMMNLVKNAK